METSQGPLFKSHCNKLLIDHLSETANHCRSVAECAANSKELLDMAWYMGALHDFGKFSSDFQRKLELGCSGKPAGAVTHSPLSAVFALWHLRNTIDLNHAVIASYYIWSHHSGLKNDEPGTNNLLTFLNNLIKMKKRGDIDDQIKYIYSNADKVGNLLKELKLDVDVRKFCAEWSNGLNYLLRRAQNFKLSEEDYFRLTALFSSLIYSDRMSAAGLESYRPTALGAAIVENYVRGLSDNKMSAFRNKVSETVSRNFKGLGELPKILSITAPTGSGKTLLALRIALEIRERVYQQSGKRPMIIYALPYINIIEQTYNVIRDVLARAGVSEDAVIKYHHLYVPEIKSERPLSQTMLLTDSWESDIVVTTFVQLFETLVGTQNNMLIKFHKLLDSIIILDEVQAIPVEHWNFIEEMLNALSKFSHIIVMSATRPILHESATELYGAGGPEMNRFAIRFNGKGCDYESFAKRAYELFENYGAVLAITNTISSSVKVYNTIKSLAGAYQPIDDYPNGKTYLAYLSTNIIPLQRGNRIENLKKALNAGERVIAVTTQVVEAGVDLDFPAVLRDMAPFDSIVQSAGRCNRNGKIYRGTVEVLKIIDEKGRPDANKIYGTIMIDKIMSNIIGSGDFQVEEKDLPELINEFYSEVKERKDTGKKEYEEYFNAMKGLKYNTLSKFKLIEELPKYSVFVEIDQTAAKLAKSLREKYLTYIKSYGNERREAYSEMKIAFRKAQEYIVDTFYEIDTELLLPELSGGEEIRYIRLEDLKKYYDKETGLIRVSEAEGYFV